jgi:hypothetical protein
MAPRIHSSQQAGKTSRRKPVVAGDGTYFAGEVIRILGLRHLDYDHLHRLFDLVRGEPREANESASWRRFTFTDLAALKVAANLIGASTRRAQRLRLKQLEEVCRHLRDVLGIKQPLIHARLHAVGATIVVQLQGKHFDSTAAQRVFDAVADDVACYSRARSLPIAKPAVRRRTQGTRVYDAPALQIKRAK